ncbi:para-aminobenzoate synthase, (PABA) [Yamadazyma tenuis]|uniref:aminodeoxychorismate synthase n=1 Tax=Candida tenuis (strain ATCC 10573 / BCRC 21748 / CBS 615 / JCM 9827 / NBRC 10315 / NRRL Y-1498 / VKM Y-70) TaxID=590646 RepID=G3BAD0_CANTC|nr:uncharacterized protein CANTEDRAFT_135960 [Yamadazyma tenuis ATCC 10573]EGV62032.1 hypothetical protein CANTEDRAFT_135960 [Yamadazyma tenuis ATCC 10573]WEJ93277.1 para-aminobenzoate synthase, (PABA) [Yamadazyma tenuis]
MILLIDSYDSFTNNLVCLIEGATNKDVVVLHNDTVSPPDYHVFLAKYINIIEYIVIGPGPGSPSNPSDVGIIDWLFDYFKQNPANCVPILGICLGFQCLCYKFGNEVEKLQNVKHGQIYNVRSLHESEKLYDGFYGKLLPSVRYHSLFVDINKMNSEIVALAVCDEIEDGQTTQILMGAKHYKLPFYGVQYHPESICSEEGANLIKSFDSIAVEYNVQNRHSELNFTQETSLLVDHLRGQINKKALVEGRYQSCESNVFVSAIELNFSEHQVTPIDICDTLVHETGETDFILLNSASTPGEWSIIGLPEAGKSEIITHSVDNPQNVKVQMFKSEDYETISLEPSKSVWAFVAQRFADNYISREVIVNKLPFSHERTFPFLGGYLGVFSYEEGCHVIIEKTGKICKDETPDLKLAFVERFLLLDHLTSKWFLMCVSSKSDHSNWCSSFANKLQELYHKRDLKAQLGLDIKDLLSEDQEVHFDLPSEEVYKRQFELCQEYLHSGDSYELCLTTPSKIHLPSTIKSWDIYKILSSKNPSPFSCFMDFDDVVLISSSPERFLSWKEEDSQKTIELRPIKGTVKNTPEMTLEGATKLLKTPKEMGENLMIVDLIRHDLHQFTKNIEVTQLMKVEEYKTVYQLVSVIKGHLETDDFHGIDILHSSLPPGSMTGAPKKRSIELLQNIEELQSTGIKGGRRGIYSGVVGYWSVTDDSDWSVVIRSIFHYKDDKENTESHKLWRIGAGGAITVLSNCNDEWEEMRLKLTSALQAFI